MKCDEPSINSPSFSFSLFLLLDIGLFSRYQNQMDFFSPNALFSEPDLPGSVNIFCRDPLYNLFVVKLPVQKCTELHPPVDCECYRILRSNIYRRFA